MPLTEKQTQNRIKYAKKKLKRIPLDMQIDDYERIKDAVTRAGYKSLNGFIKQAINEKLEREVPLHE